MVVDHGQHDVRELRAQAGDGARHERREGGRHAAEPQSPLLPAEDVEEVALGGVEAGDDGPGVLGQDVAGGSQLHRPRPAVHEAGPDLALQRGHVLAHRRLADAQRRGGTGERSRRLDGGEGLQARASRYQSHLSDDSDWPLH